MIYKNSKTKQSPICDFVPGYGYYNGIGLSLAENLLEIFEWLLGLRR